MKATLIMFIVLAGCEDRRPSVLRQADENSVECAKACAPRKAERWHWFHGCQCILEESSK